MSEKKDIFLKLLSDMQFKDKRVSVRIPFRLWEFLNKAAFNKGLSLSAYLRYIIIQAASKEYEDT